MITKLTRQDCRSKFHVFPVREYDRKKKEFDERYPEVFAHYILSVTGKSLKGHIKILSKSIIDLASYFNFNELIFLGDSKTAWLALDHDYKPAKEGLQYLESKKIGKRFNGALVVSNDEAMVFLKHLVWMARCNAIEPYVYFTDPGQNIVASICQYANLHISAVTEKANEIPTKAVDETSLEFTDGSCENKYYKSGGIQGRRMIWL